MVEAVGDDQNGGRAAHGDPKREIEVSLRSGASIAGVSEHARPSHGGYDTARATSAREMDAPDASVVRIRDVEVARRVDGHACWVTEHGSDGRLAVAAEAGDAVAGDGADGVSPEVDHGDTIVEGVGDVQPRAVGAERGSHWIREMRILQKFAARRRRKGCP